MAKLSEMSKIKKNDKNVCLAFAALDKYLEDNIIDNVQKEIKGKDIVEYGQKNIYPNYLYNLYEKVSVLRSIINGLPDYVVGENIIINIPQFQEKINKDQTIEDVARDIALSYVLYGGVAINVVRNRLGGIAALYVLDFKHVRSNKKNTKFYYSKEWGDKQIGRVDTIVYPAFDPEGKDINSIFYVKNDNFDTYPNPLWAGAVISAEILKHVDEFNLNSLYNGLSGGYIVNFNNGQPTDEQKEEISDDFDSKYVGFDNASRTLLSFNPDYDHRTTIEALPEDKSIDRYNTIYQTSIKNIFTAFRCHPVIFGLPTDNSGFNDQDFAEAFKICNKTVVLPLQKKIKRIFETIFGQKDVVTIEPMKIDWTEDETENTDFVK